MGLVVYFFFGVLAVLTAVKAIKSRRLSGRVFWAVASCAFLVVAVIAAWRGITTFPDLIFYFLALVCVISAIRVVSQTNPVHSAVWLITVFLCMAVLFILRRAEFLAAVQALIYAGAIMVLYVFIIVFVDVDVAMEESAPPWLVACALGVAGALLLIFAPVALSLRPAVSSAPEMAGYTSAEAMGEAIYFGAAVPFEVASLILLVALIGAVLIGKAEKE